MASRKAWPLRGGLALATPGHILISMRPKQWTKNLAVLIALIFSVSFTSADLVARSLAALGLFCLLSSAEYLFNDFRDREADRQHPRKRERPLASGRLGVAPALATAAMLAALGLGLGFWLDQGVGWVALAYLGLMAAYSLGLKRLVIIDVLAIAAGFVLRAVAGAVAIDVVISPWLYICTVLGALFIGLIKRRQELVLLEANAAHHRPSLQSYTPRLLEEMIAVVTASTVIAYSLYTFSAPNLPPNHAMMLTIPFVLYGIFRYLYLVHGKNMGGSPEEALLKDPPLLLTVLLWAATSAAILYIYR